MKDIQTLRIMIVFFLLLALLGFWSSINRWEYARSSVSWPSIEGKITYSGTGSSTSRRRRGSGSTSYRVKVEYEYVVKGVTYSGSRISFGASPGGKGEAGRAEALQASIRYDIMKNLRVYYDPNAPSNAVLEPGPGSYHRLPLASGILCLLIAVGLAYLYLYDQETWIKMNRGSV